MKLKTLRLPPRQRCPFLIQLVKFPPVSLILMSLSHAPNVCNATHRWCNKTYQTSVLTIFILTGAQTIMCGIRFHAAVITWYTDRQTDTLLLPAKTIWLSSGSQQGQRQCCFFITLPCRIKSIPSSVRHTRKLSDSQTGRQADKQPLKQTDSSQAGQPPTQPGSQPTKG